MKGPLDFVAIRSPRHLGRTLPRPAAAEVPRSAFDRFGFEWFLVVSGTAGPFDERYARKTFPCARNGS